MAVKELSQRKALKELLKLVQENPGLPVYPLADWDRGDVEEGCSYLGEISGCRVDKICFTEKRILLASDYEYPWEALEDLGYDTYLMEDSEVETALGKLMWEDCITFRVTAY